MTLVITLLLCGVLLLALELVVPGAIIGIVGGLVLLAGVLVAFSEFGPEVGFATLAGALLVLGLVVYLELVWLPKSRLARHFSMSRTLEGQSQPPIADAAAVIGSLAVAETVLSPSGYVKVEGRRYEAFCRDGFIEAGAQVKVVALDNFRLIVSRVS